MLNTYADLCKVISTGDVVTANLLGHFLIRVRQKRGKLKSTVEQLNEKFNVHNFASKRAAWRLRGKASCRHGILFLQLPPGGCKCMAPESNTDADWQHARYIPSMNTSLKCIVAVCFDKPAFKRLATLQADARALQW